jgi:hypothetical protein
MTMSYTLATNGFKTVRQVLTASNQPNRTSASKNSSVVRWEEEKGKAGPGYTETRLGPRWRDQSHMTSIQAQNPLLTLHQHGRLTDFETCTYAVSLTQTVLTRQVYEMKPP